MTGNLDIVQLIEKNPITRLTNNNYQNKFIEKIKENFTESQQQLFVSSFYCYLNYNSKKEFIIDLDNIWKWLGYGRKSDCKRVLEKNFIINIDYKISEEIFATEVAVAKINEELIKDNRGGYNKEKIMMTINIFKKLCLKSNTKKADEIHEYYLKMEDILLEIVDEQNDELRNQLEQKEIENQLINIELSKEKEEKELQISLMKHKDKMIEELTEINEYGSVYLRQINNLPNNTKIGKSKDLIERNDRYNTSAPNSLFIFTYKSKNYAKIEATFKHLCKPFLSRKKDTGGVEWYDLTAEESTKILEFVINMWDSYKIYNKDGLLKFVSRFDNKRPLTITKNNNDKFFNEEIYKNYIEENVVIGEQYIVPFTLITEDFVNWITNKGYSENELMSPNKNYKLKFLNELTNNIEKNLQTKKVSINLIEALRGYNFNKVGGFYGFELKSMKNGNDIFYDTNIYEFILKEILEEKTKNNVTSKEIIQAFLDKCDEKEIKSKKSLYRKEDSKDQTQAFKAEFRFHIINLFKNSVYKNSVTSANYRCIPGYTNLILI